MKQFDLIRQLHLEDKIKGNFTLKSVKFFELLNKLEVSIEWDGIDEASRELVAQQLRDQFLELDVHIDFEKNIKEEESIQRSCNEEYVEEILQYIRDKVPTLKGVDLCEELSEGSLTICVSNEIIKNRIETNGVPGDVAERFFKDCGETVHLNVILRENFDVESFEDLVGKKELRIAKKIAENIVTTSSAAPEKRESVFKIGKTIQEPPIKIIEATEEYSNLVLCGQVNEITIKEIKGNKSIVEFDLWDETGAVSCKQFLSKELTERFRENVQQDEILLVEGTLAYDNYAKCRKLQVKNMTLGSLTERKDMAKTKRVELSLHTQMSAMDGFIKPKTLMKQLKKWGYTAVGITDSGVVQGFPEAYAAGAKEGIKVLLGLDSKLLEDHLRVFTGSENVKNSEEFVAFDIETTGLSRIHDQITEIGAVRIRQGSVVDVFQTLVNPQQPISQKITELTGITNEMVKDQETIHTVLPRFLEFVGDAVLVAHNAEFDVGFIKEKARVFMGVDYRPAYVDTMNFSRKFLSHLKNHRLNTVSKDLGIRLLNHHRASDDAKACGEIFMELTARAQEQGMAIDEGLNTMETSWDKARNHGTNVTIYAANYVGLKNLYRIVSSANLNYFFREPGIPKSLLEENREGLIVGSGNGDGELFQAALDGATDDELRGIMDFYDFIQIEPADINTRLYEQGFILHRSEIEAINRRLYELGREKNIPVVATGNVKYMEKTDYIFRNIVLVGQGKYRGEEEGRYFFRTTDEMLEEFSYLGKEIAQEVVVKNPLEIAEGIEALKPIPDGTYPPIIPGSDEELRAITFNKAKEIYGEELPQLVKSRLDRELNSIIANGYAVLYIIAQKLVTKSNEQGYQVGSRGSVGSSFAATMAGITEVNPLPPHYICNNCKHSEFVLDGSYGSGVDLPDKICSKCGQAMAKEGHDIPFEVFLGFEGDKEPDIDLNFAGEYQSEAHKYVEELFGSDKVYRAGTINTIAEKTTYGYINKYYEEKELEMPQPAEKRRLYRAIDGVRRTSGQHPGGIMIVPRDKDILDFTPVQHPADDTNSDIITTHFSYKSISGRILKLDLLGHDVPSIIYMLEELTGVDPMTIPLDDEETMSLFSGTAALNLKTDFSNNEMGTLGIPEFGTGFVRQMLKDTRPTTFAELVRISGLSHGTDVWLNNAQELIRKGTAELSETICTRDDIMIYLIQKDLEKKKAFTIMEKVRKGMGVTEEMEKDMLAKGVPQWYIDSCRKIKYMFPKAHAVAYVLMSYRIAYFKVHYPAAFYCTYFTTKIQDFPYTTIYEGMDSIQRTMLEIKNLGDSASNKEGAVYNVLEVAEEMYARGLRIEKADLYRSHATKFLVESTDSILPPLSAVDSVSQAIARSIDAARQQGEFISVEDLGERTGITKNAVQAMRDTGMIDFLQETNQISLFSMF